MNSEGRRRLLWAAAACVPPLLLALFVAWNYVDIPFWDQWDQVPLLEKAHNGSLSWNDLWTPQNEHRLLSYYALWLPLAYLSHWNHGLELATSLLVCLGGYLLLVSWFGRAVLGLKRREPERWHWAAFSAMAFSGIQWENWFSGHQLCYLLNVAAVIAGFIAVGRSANSLGWGVAVIPLALIAATSTANGLLFLPLAFLLIAVGGSGRRSRLLLALWAAAAAGLFLGYFTGYRAVAGHPSMWDALQAPAVYLRYVLNFLGAPLIWNSWLAAVPGAFGLALFAWLAFRHSRDLRTHFEWLAPLFGMGLYAIASALLIGLGRAGFGAVQAVTPRYTSYSMLLWISVVGLIALLPDTQPPAVPAAGSRRLLAGTARAILLLVCLNSLVGYRTAAVWLPMRMGAPRQAILEGRNDPELLARIYPDPGRLSAWLAFLREHRLSLYRERR